MKSNYGIQACSYDDAIRQISSNDSDKTFAYLEFRSKAMIDATITPLEVALAGNMNLKVVHIVTQGCDSSVVMELCRGLRASRTIETVVWYMAPNDRTRRIAMAIGEWVKHSNALVSLSILRLNGYPAPMRNGSGSITVSRNTGTTQPCDNVFAQTTFNDLASSGTLRSFHLESYIALSNETKELFFDEMQENESLLNVFMEFHERDYRLSLFQRFNAGKWKQRWSTTNNATLLEISKADALEPVLTEVLALPELDSVAAAYTLFKRSSDILQQL